jgi:hypothetical protein
VTPVATGNSDQIGHILAKREWCGQIMITLFSLNLVNLNFVISKIWLPLEKVENLWYLYFGIPNPTSLKSFSFLYLLCYIHPVWITTLFKWACGKGKWWIDLCCLLSNRKMLFWVGTMSFSKDNILQFSLDLPLTYTVTL